MVYSVYHHGKRAYEYYEDAQTEGTHAGAPGGVASGKLGVTPEGGAWRLPIGSRRTGEGPLPRGRIASKSGSPLSGIDWSSPANLVVAAALGYLGYLALRKASR